MTTTWQSIPYSTALKYAERYQVTLLPVIGKEVVSDPNDQRHWQHWFDKPLEDMRWDSGTGYAILCGPGNYRCIDIDGVTPETRQVFLQKLLALLELPSEYEWVVQTCYGTHIWVRVPPFAEETYDVMKWNPDEEHKGFFKRIELRWQNSYALVPPSLHPDGPTYRFLQGRFPDAAPLEVSFEQVEKALYAIGVYDNPICGGCYRPWEACICVYDEPYDEPEYDGYVFEED